MHDIRRFVLVTGFGLALLTGCSSGGAGEGEIAQQADPLAWCTGQLSCVSDGYPIEMPLRREGDRCIDTSFHQRFEPNHDLVDDPTGKLMGTWSGDADALELCMKGAAKCLKCSNPEAKRGGAANAPSGGAGRCEGDRHCAGTTRASCEKYTGCWFEQRAHYQNGVVTSYSTFCNGSPRQCSANQSRGECNGEQSCSWRE